MYYSSEFLILERLQLMRYSGLPPFVDLVFLRSRGLHDMWQRRVFVALMRRYGLRPYRYSGQRYTTVMARVPRRFVNETLWPEFLEFSQTLQSYLSEVTERVVSQVICQDNSEAEVIEEPKRLSSSIDPDHLESMEAEDLH